MIELIISLDSGQMERLTRYPDRYAREMSAAVVETSAMLATAAQLLAMEHDDLGTLSHSIFPLPIQTAGTTVMGGIGTALSYARPVELGTRPHFPPMEPLAGWVRRKLAHAVKALVAIRKGNRKTKAGAEDREAAAVKSIAFCIARKISIHGTKGKGFFKQAHEENAERIQAILRAAVARALEGAS